jgi:hypothetical protein
MTTTIITTAGDGAGAVVTCLIQLQPAGVSRPVRPFLGRLVRSRLRKDLARLKGLLEGGARAGSAPVRRPWRSARVARRPRGAVPARRAARRDREWRRDGA